MSDLDQQWLDLYLQAQDEPDPERRAELLDLMHARYIELFDAGLLGGSTTSGLPYPVPTDPVAQGADAIKALAQAIDPRLPTAGAWTAYTPAWTASGGGNSMGNGSISGRYSRLGKTCTFYLQMTMGTTGGSGGSGFWSWTIPFASLAFTDQPISGFLNNAGAPRIPVAGTISSNSNQVGAVADGTGALLAAGYTLKAGSQLQLAGTYETA